jgi:hypothetical protein
MRYRVEVTGTARSSVARRERSELGSRRAIARFYLLYRTYIATAITGLLGHPDTRYCVHMALP